MDNQDKAASLIAELNAAMAAALGRLEETAKGSRILRAAIDERRARPHKEEASAPPPPPALG